MAISVAEWILGFFLILSSIGVIACRQPVYSGLSFLLTLITLSALYLQLEASFIALMQVVVYAGAILVIFMFVILLFQEAHGQVASFREGSHRLFLLGTALLLGATFLALGIHLSTTPSSWKKVEEGYGTAQFLGKSLYIDYFFPFEAVVLLFLVAIVGAVYMGKREG